MLLVEEEEEKEKAVVVVITWHIVMSNNKNTFIISKHKDVFKFDFKIALTEAASTLM